MLNSAQPRLARRLAPDVQTRRRDRPSRDVDEAIDHRCAHPRHTSPGGSAGQADRAGIEAEHDRAAVACDAPALGAFWGR